ncbi:MAG: integrase core domain-containing protein [Actinoallomurus sp.]
MGRTGSALDNAVAEAFNSTVEAELLSRSGFTTREQARRAVAGWIDLAAAIWHNNATNTPITRSLIAYDH